MIVTVLRHKVSGFVLFIGLFSLGCGGKPPVVKTSVTKPVDNTGVQIDRLEAEPTESVARELMQALDLMGGIEARPTLSEADFTRLAEFVPLNRADRDEITSGTFTSLDPYYLEESLLLRDALRSLDLELLPELRRANLAFDWVCRQIYLDQRLVPGAPPWYSLEGGSGNPLDRAYVMLGLLHQMGMDGCLIGPADIQTIPVAQLQNRKEGPSWNYTPIRAVGVRIGKEIFLFDPVKGIAFPDETGKGVATLSLLRKKPELLKQWCIDLGCKPEEIAQWRAFLTCPISGLAPRMKWLEEKLAEKSPVRLAWDLLAIRDRFRQEAGEADCSFWAPIIKNPSRLTFDGTYGQIYRRFYFDGQLLDGSTLPAMKPDYQNEYVPLNFVPVLIVRDKLKPQFVSRVGGAGQRMVEQIYREPIQELMFHYSSPRDRILRGQFQAASIVLSDMKDRQEAVRIQANNSPDLVKAFEEWTELAKDVFADQMRAEASGDPNAIDAAKVQRAKLQQNPLTQKAFLYIRRASAKVVSAEVAYLTALCAHERAERVQIRLEVKSTEALKAESLILWANAQEMWETFINNYPELRPIYPPKFAQAKRLLQEAKRQATPGK